jgi:mono/diheme cytochrome c family protein
MYPVRLARVLALLVSWQGLLLSGVSEGETTNVSEPLAWDAVTKTYEAKAGETEARFFFSATNISAADVVVERVQTSCGCSIAEIPSQPWILKPHQDGKINVTVNLAGKIGALEKTVTVYFTSGDPKVLMIKLILPEMSGEQRLRNQQIAQRDRQKVFQDSECARCHAEPARGKTGKELFTVACGICHDSDHRATMVPDLHALKHPTDQAYWKHWITEGKPGTLMPGFGADLGGPLDSKQIDSLVDYVCNAMPHDVGSPSSKPDSVAPSPNSNQP